MTSPLRVARQTITGATLACLVALLAGCSSSGSPAGSHGAVPATTAPVTAVGTGASTPTEAASAGASTPSTAASTGAASTPAGTAGTQASFPAQVAASSGAVNPLPCPSRYLAAKAGVSQGTAGSIYTALVFTNISATTCTLYGYPGVSFAGGTPVSQIGLPAAQSHATARTLVTLAPGATANALLQMADPGNYPPASCHPVTATYLQIYPPNQTTPIYLGYSSPACSLPVRTLTVGVVQPGSGSASG